VHDPAAALSPDPLAHECARRCAWFIRLMYIQQFSYHSVSIPPPECDNAVHLPVDEASFDMDNVGHVVLGKPRHISNLTHHLCLTWRLPSACGCRERPHYLRVPVV
jgi:hypothetical protein